MSFLGRYERFGWDYERYNPPDARAEAWYRRHARETGGPVLELACGGGSLLAVLAEDGREVAGLDLSPAMLALARRRVAALPPDVRRRIRLVEGDMRCADLGRTFALVIVADNSLREVESRDGILETLVSIRRHLRPVGRLLVTERRFDPRRYPGGVGVWPWTEPHRHPVTGESVRRRVTVRFDGAARCLSGVMTYRVRGADGTEREERFLFEGPVFTVDDYRRLLHEAGFATQVCVGYEEREDDGRDPVLCFVARPTSGGTKG